jgi:hypothetical protein
MTTKQEYVGARQFDVGAGEQSAAWSDDPKGGRLEPGLRDEADRGGRAPREQPVPSTRTRTDERILADIQEVLRHRRDVDARGVQIAVCEGEVVLSGTVPMRRMKYALEEICGLVSGVAEISDDVQVHGPA